MDRKVTELFMWVGLDYEGNEMMCATGQKEGDMAIMLPLLCTNPEDVIKLKRDAENAHEISKRPMRLLKFVVTEQVDSLGYTTPMSIDEIKNSIASVFGIKQ